jgi:hypothetical protein
MVLKDLVENTDPVRIAADFPRYVHRLRHRDTRLLRLLQKADLDSAFKLAVETMRVELRTLLDFSSSSSSSSLFNDAFSASQTI